MKAYVLAGGRSTRMGTDKARLFCRGLPLAAAVAEVLDSVGLDVTIVRRVDDGLPFLNRQQAPWRVLFEPSWAEVHPLWGVACAVEDAGGKPIMIVPCDLPMLNAEAVRRLMDHGPCVAKGPDGRRHPLCAVLPGDWDAATLRQAAILGERVQDRFVELEAVELPAAALLNANRPEDRPSWPLRVLAERLPRGGDVHRVLDGERRRLAARGVLDGVSFDREEEG